MTQLYFQIGLNMVCENLWEIFKSALFSHNPGSTMEWKVCERSRVLIIAQEHAAYINERPAE